MSAIMCKTVETEENIYVCRWEYLHFFEAVSMEYKLGLLPVYVDVNPSRHNMLQITLVVNSTG